MLAALLSSLASATGLIIDKIALSRERISLRVFLPIGFILVFGMTFVLVPFLGHFDLGIALLPNTLFLVFLMVVVAVAWNVLYYQGVQRDKIHQHEMLMMTLPIITIILAAIFFPEEINKWVLTLAIIASGALLFARGEKEHFFVNTTSFNTFLAVVLMATESIIIRQLLFSFTPVALYAIRTGFVALFFVFYYRPRYSQVTASHWWLIAWSSLFGVITMLGRYYAYSELGIVYTTMITILAPIIVFLASWEILHERIRPRVIVAALIILACVTVATVISFGS